MDERLDELLLRHGAITPEQLETFLAPQAFAPCSSLEMLSQGWVSPRNNGMLVHTVNRQMTIQLGTEKKLLPSSVINQVTKARAAEDDGVVAAK